MAVLGAAHDELVTHNTLTSSEDFTAHIIVATHVRFLNSINVAILSPTYMIFGVSI